MTTHQEITMGPHRLRHKEEQQMLQLDTNSRKTDTNLNHTGFTLQFNLHNKTTCKQVEHMSNLQEDLQSTNVSTTKHCQNND